MSPHSEVCVNDAEGREKALRVSRRLESLQHTLSQLG